MKQENAVFDQLLKASPDEFIRSWLADVAATGVSGSTSANDAHELFAALQTAVAADADLARLDDTAWTKTRSVLAALSQSRAAQGASAGDTSQFVMSIKKPLFDAIQLQLGGEGARAAFDAARAASTLVDKLAQFTATTYQRSREEVIQRQQQELLELSTPVVKLWDGVLAVPMIGTLDSSRTQLVMESLLTRIVETGSELAIIDITGVPTVDTLVAQHLLKTVTAIRLMGADCIISGIRPQIAQTIVHLGIDLQGITTKATLADASADVPIPCQQVELQAVRGSSVELDFQQRTEQELEPGPRWEMDRGPHEAVQARRPASQQRFQPLQRRWGITALDLSDRDLAHHGRRVLQDALDKAVAGKPRGRRQQPGERRAAYGRRGVAAGRTRDGLRAFRSQVAHHVERHGAMPASGTGHEPLAGAFEQSFASHGHRLQCQGSDKGIRIQAQIFEQGGRQPFAESGRFSQACGS